MIPKFRIKVEFHDGFTVTTDQEPGLSLLPTYGAAMLQCVGEAAKKRNPEEIREITVTRLPAESQ